MSSCDNLSIEITAVAAHAAIQKFCNLPPKTPLESDRPEYSKEAFVDALVEFIVRNDQVHIQFYLTITKINIHVVS